MHEAANGKIQIMPGGGIKPELFSQVYRNEITEYHLSGRMPHFSQTPSTLFEMDWAETARESIERVAFK
jgi:copper homeostasis protein CutC